MSMFCYQCQEAAKGVGCQSVGVCGKTEDVANLQDLLLYALKGYVVFGTDHEDKEYDRVVATSLFITITNSNFDRQAIIKQIRKLIALRDEKRNNIADLSGVKFSDHDAANFTVSKETIDEKAASVSILNTKNEDIRSLRELLTYGLKGIAAYAEHASNLGSSITELSQFAKKALLATLDDTLSADELVGLVMECGKYGVDAMAVLDGANTAAYGNPEITEVNLGVGTRPGILISGHDLLDMAQLLEQTKDSGVDVYTHSEMLPAHYYPAFKKYDHFVGNYGNAWHKQNIEFKTFNGPILFTTNCIVPSIAKSDYAHRIFTTGASGLAGAKHIDADENGKKDFSELVEMAKTCQPPVAIEEGTLVGGFAHHQVIALADKVVDAVKSGAIKKFVVMAGCDGRFKSRNYYTEFAEELPQDSVILTAGCAKYRYNKLNLGDIGGIPRVLDAGQCNDSYSLVVIALKLKEVFGLDDINDLPIVYNIAWYEQKAVIVLLALLYLGVKNIHLGPTLPAFLSPNVTKILVDTFGISGISDVQSDIKSMIG